MFLQYIYISLTDKITLYLLLKNTPPRMLNEQILNF